MRSRYLAIALASMLGAASASGQQGTDWQSSIVEPVSYAPGEEAADSTAVTEAMPGDTQGCTAGACDTCDDCGCDDCGGMNWWRPKPMGMFAEFEMLAWWTKQRSQPPLVTTSPAGTPLLTTGVLPGATVLYGGSNDGVGDNPGYGGRLTLGKWLDCSQTMAIAARFTSFRADDGDFAAASDGTTNLAIPFFDPIRFPTPGENSYIVAFSPNGVTPFASGNVDISDRLDFLATEVYGQFLLYDEPGTRFDMLMGYHMVRLDNSLAIQSVSNTLDPGFGGLLGTQILIQDVFEGRNEFHGGTLGMIATMDFDRWFVNATAKMSIGNMRQTVIIDGNTAVVTPGPSLDIRDEGLFALGTNQGIRSRNRTAYIPEANIKLGYRVRENVAVSLGYNFMYVSSVVLGGDQIDRNVNLSQTNGGFLVGPVAPNFLGFRETDFWAQGLTAGLEVAF
jgi:hypothetical protein